MTINCKATVLIAHGDPAARDLLKEMLQGRYHIQLAASGADNLRLPGSTGLAPRPDLIVLDAAIADGGGETGMPALPLIVLADTAQQEAQAWRAGAADVLMRPVSAAALRARVAQQLELAALRGAPQAAAVGPIDDGAVMAMAVMAEAHDPRIGRHLLRTQRLVAALAAELRFHERFRDALTPEQVALIVKAAPLHDIGKMTVDPAILRKPGKLTAEEFAAMRAHTTSGRDAIEAAARTLGGATPFLRVAADIAFSHQEKWDGSGYPQGLKGDAIPVAARLMAAADVYDALVTSRSYRPAFTHETAVELIRQERGEHFDPDVADAVLLIEERFRAIAAELADGN